MAAPTQPVKSTTGGNPYHDANGRFCSRDEMRIAVDKAVLKLGLAVSDRERAIAFKEFMNLKQDFDAAENQPSVIADTSLWGESKVLQMINAGAFSAGDEKKAKENLKLQVQKEETALENRSQSYKESKATFDSLKEVAERQIHINKWYEKTFKNSWVSNSSIDSVDARDVEYLSNLPFGTEVALKTREYSFVYGRLGDGTINLRNVDTYKPSKIHALFYKGGFQQLSGDKVRHGDMARADEFSVSLNGAGFNITLSNIAEILILPKGTINKTNLIPSTAKEITNSQPQTRRRFLLQDNELTYNLHDANLTFRTKKGTTAKTPRIRSDSYSVETDVVDGSPETKVYALD